MRCLRILRSATALACLALAAALPVRAADNQSIAAIVNDDLISTYDLNARLRMSLVVAGLQDTAEARERLAPQILRGLIDERLQLQEAKRLNITVSDKEIDRSMAAIEQGNKLPPGGLENYLRQNGVDKATALIQVRAGLAWNKVLGRRARGETDVGEDEIDDYLAQLKSREGLLEFEASEIFLAVDDPSQEAAVKETADGLIQQMRSGVSFAALARQFSQSSTAAIGGDLGRVQEGQLEATLDTALKGLEPGSVSFPIRVDSGYYILGMRSKQRIAGAKPEDTEIALRRIFFPVPADSPPEAFDTQAQLAATIGETVKGCADMERVGKELSTQESVDAGRLKLVDLPENLRGVVAPLKVGQPSKPVRFPTGVAILMVCERKDGPSNLPSRDEVAKILSNQRADMLSRRYLRDLRRTAFVDLRV